ncbi:MAG: tRNA pseudouridine(55) synthase TruB [bacterium]
MSAPEDGLCVVDKPGGRTSHDVVARVRRIAGTRRVGHAGTLDPMATGVLLLGVGRATRLLGHLALTDKSYDATVCLGRSTVTDDAEGDLVREVDSADITEAQVRQAAAAFVGEIEQVPSAVSAIKVGGRRAYAQVRAGEQVDLAARRVTVSRLDVLAVRHDRPGLVDVDIRVDCSTGTYIRAIARDLGAALAVGGHLTALRRTRVGPFTLADAHPLEALAGLASPVTVPLAQVVTACFPRRDVDREQARLLSHGRPLDAMGRSGPYGAFGPDGAVLALLEESGEVARPLVVLAPAAPGGE